MESRIATGVTAASVSPDERYLVYSRYVNQPTEEELWSDAGETLLRDLTSGTERKLFGYRVSGLNWSPDSQRLSYKRLHALYVSTLTGESQLIYTEDSRWYQQLGSDSVHTVFGEASKAIWVGPDRLVFRSVTVFPKEIYGDVIPSEATKLALLGKHKKLIDVSRRWYVGARCAAQPFVIFAQDSDSGPLFLARDFVDFEKTELKPLPYPNAGFMPRSCKLYSVITDSSSGRSSLKFIDPSTLKAEDGPVLGTKGRILSSLVDSEENTITLLYALEENNTTQFGLSIVDLKTGDETELLKSSDSTGPDEILGFDLELLAWLSQ